MALMRSDDAVRHIEQGLNALLEPFNRRVSSIHSRYLIDRDYTEIRVHIRLPWGDDMTAGCSMPHFAMVEKHATQVILEIIYRLAKTILDEQDIKEEVAEGSLPPEALDALAGIENVPHPMVI